MQLFFILLKAPPKLQKKNPTKIKKKETYNGGKIWKETMALQIWKLENR